MEKGYTEVEYTKEIELWGGWVMLNGEMRCLYGPYYRFELQEDFRERYQFRSVL